MKSDAGGFRAGRRVGLYVPGSVIGFVVLLVPVEERLNAQECPELPVFDDAEQLEWDEGFPLSGVVGSFCTSADGLTMYVDQLNGQRIWKAQREDRDDPWSSTVETVPFPVTSDFQEWGPTLSPDGHWLYFNSTREGGYEIYAAAREDPAASFERVVKLGPSVNRGSTWMGSVSHDGKEIYYTNPWDIWVASFNEPGNPEAGFVDARPLTVLHSPAQTMAPRISPEGTMLFFSDRPQEWAGGGPPRQGGMGSTDLWVALRCRFPDGAFGPWEKQPLNVASINTAGDEYSPWISSDGESLLYATGSGFPQEALLDFSECSEAPLAARRRIVTEESIGVHHEDRPAWSPGARYQVTIELADIRAPDASCGAPTEVVIEETVPPGWEVDSPSDCGEIIAEGTIRWTLRAGECGGAGFPDVLSYEVEAGFEPDLAVFHGTIRESGAAARFSVEGAGRLVSKEDSSGEGFIRRWLLLGPYQQASDSCFDAATPGEDLIRADYLADGMGTTEASVQPRAGDTADTDYGGASASAGLAPTDTGINPRGVPTWHPWRAEDDTVDFDAYYGPDIDRVMMYAVVYFHVEDDLSAQLELASDDSVQVLVDDEEILINNVGRGAGGKGEVQDFALIDLLEAGPHTLMAKVFDGCGAHRFRLRFQNLLTGEPLRGDDGLTVCLTPEECGFAPPVPRFRRGDCNDDGGVNIADAVCILSWLFAGEGDPGCIAATNTNGDDTPNITDATYLLIHLFSGGPEPVPPFPDCGPVTLPADKEFGCTTQPGC